MDIYEAIAKRIIELGEQHPEYNEEIYTIEITLLLRLDYEKLVKSIDSIRNSHNWEVDSPGEYDTTYKCSKCGECHTESVDNPDKTKLPVSGCTGGVND